MIQGHQKSRQSDNSAAAAAATVDTGSTSMPGSSNQDPAGSNQPQDVPAALAGGPESHFYLEVTVHLTSSEALVRACPECCHKVEGKVRKPSNGPGAPSKLHGANDNVDPGQILQFCVSDHVVDFTNGTSTVMAKVLCSSTHHDKRGNNDRYFFKLSLMQYINGQKIRVGSCRTKDILFTGNHKNKSMASFSEDKGDVKPRIHRSEEEAVVGEPSMLIGQPFYSEEPDSIPEESPEKYGHSQTHSTGRPHQSSQHQSYPSYNSPRLYNSEHIPRIHEPSATNSDEPQHRHHSVDRDLYSNAGSRSPLVGQGATHSGSTHNQTSSAADTRLGFTPVKSKSWNDTLTTPKITKTIPDVGDMLGGTELTIFGSGFSDRVIPYFDSLPATDVKILHHDVLTCRTPPRLDPKLVHVSFHSKLPSLPLGRTTSDIQFSAEQRVGGLGDLRSKATRVVRRGSMRRDSSDISTSQRSGLGGSRLNPMSDSPRLRPSHSPLPHDQTLEDDEEFERVVADMVARGVNHSVAPSVQSSNALESAILNVLTLTTPGDLSHISQPNNQGHTMLHLAVVLDMSQLVNYFLSVEIEINAEDCNGFTALHYAAWLGRTTIYETLKRHGASDEISNRHGALPPHLFADSPATPHKFAAMYHSKPSLLHDNLKDGIHATYSRAKKARSSSGH
ncbi:SPT3 Dosage dependent suppressor of Ty-induced promoter mutations-like protein, partial [Modicella reniformis]